MTFFNLTFSLVIGLSAYMGWRALIVTRVTIASCASLLSDMRHVDLTEICVIARDMDRMIPARELFLRLGGLEGLKRLRTNADLMFRTAQYLSLIDPQAQDLARTIRGHAAQVRRLALLLILQHRLKLTHVNPPESAYKLACVYVTLSCNHLKLCGCLVDEILDLTRRMDNIQRAMMGA